MASKYYGILTTKGRALYANALLLNQDVNLSEMAIDDTVNFLPDEKLESLPSEVYRAELNSLEKDEDNDEMVIAELVIPSQSGGFYCRGFGLYTDTGILFAVGSLAETYKATEDEGSGGELVIQADIVVTNTAALVLKVDPTTVLATRETVDRAIAAHEAKLDPHPQYAPKNSPTLTGIPKAPTPAEGNNTTQIATTAFVQAIATALNTALALKAPLASPGLTGTPTAPTAAQSTNNTQIATTAFVKSAIAALVASSPAALDTLNELAAALGNDPNFATTMTNALAGKQPLDSMLTNLSGKDVAGLLSYLGLGEGSMLPVGTPIPWPLATPPTGFLKMNGATFDKVANPKLALAYPSGVLPDLRAQTIRGWDDGRGIDTGRALLSEQGDAIRNIIGSAANVYTGNPDLATGVITYTGTGITSWQSGTGLSISYRNLNINAATQVPTAAENRVKSVAFNYIVRAQ